MLAVALGLGIYLKNKKTGTGTIASIAVLPLDMRSKDPDADDISDGIAESINNSLARLPGLKVVPNSVASRYKAKAADFQKIGESLGVQAILSGLVEQRGADLSIDIELDDVQTESNSGASNIRARSQISSWCRTKSLGRFRSGCGRSSPQPIGKS